MPRPTPSWTSWPTTSRRSRRETCSRRSSPGRCAASSRRRARGPEPLEAILEDYVRLVEPNATQWQHPGFMAYFATTASGPGILGEMLTAVLGQNPMLWRTSPIGTELEGVVVDWLRQALGLPEAFDGLITDTASTSSLIALAAARQAAGFDVAQARADRARRSCPRCASTPRPRRTAPSRRRA